MRDTSTMPDPLEAGREAFEREDWTEAFQVLTAAPHDLLEAGDYERLAVASYLIGNDRASSDRMGRRTSLLPRGRGSRGRRPLLLLARAVPAAPR